MPVKTTEENISVNEANCLNCNAKLSGRFCHNCGQNNFYRRLQLKEFFKTFLDNLTSLETAFFRTFAGLSVSPGTVAREYVLGKRRTYTNPLKYYLICMTIFLLAGALMPIDKEMIFNEMLMVNPSEEARRFALSFMDLMIDYMKLTNLFGYLALPFILRGFFRKSEFTYLDNIVWVLFSLGHLSFLTIFTHWLMYMGHIQLSTLVTFAGAGIYLLWAGLGYYQQWTVKSALKITLAYSISILIMFITMAAVGVYIGMKYKMGG